jgi:probable rRNA maturation factor
MRVRTVLADGSSDIPRRPLALLARRVLRGEEGQLNVSLIFAGDDTLRDLNRRYRKIDRTTDVLSFNIPGVTGVEPDGGEIYISVPQARKQARRYRHSLTSELQRLVVHGTLHLLGHDHKHPAQTTRMRELEGRYLGAMLR